MKEVNKMPKKVAESKETIEDLEKRKEFSDDEVSQDEQPKGREDLLCVDNKAATQILVQESGSWRTRRLRVRAAALKQRIEAGRQKVVHVPGRSMLADLNTKSHPFARLQQLRKLWGIEEMSHEGDDHSEKIQKVRVEMLKIPKEYRSGSSTDPRPEEERDEVEIIEPETLSEES